MQLISKTLILLAHILLFAICVNELTYYMSQNFPLWAIASMIILLSLLIALILTHVKTFITYLKNKSQS